MSNNNVVNTGKPTLPGKYTGVVKKAAFNAVRSPLQTTKSVASAAKFALLHPMQGTRNLVDFTKKGWRATTNAINEMAQQEREGKAMSFNAKKPLIVQVSNIGGKIFGSFAENDKITQIMIVIIGLLFFIIFWWVLNKFNLNENNCTSLENVYSKFPVIQSINIENPNFCYKLRDFYIKTAYNCCASGKYKNDFVNVCALKNCIRQGARCLDFEIYSVNNKPVIAVSSVGENTIKESYNTVPFAKAMEIVGLYAFSGSTCPNPSDPLILNFRIMSNNKNIYNDIAKSLYNTLEDRLLGKQFSYENNGVNIGAMQLKKLMGRIIIIADKANPLFTDTLLNEYVNIASNTPFMRSLRYKDVQFTPDMEELKFYNKQNMTICLPNLSAKNSNYSARLAMAYGCQFIAMSFQNFDSYMEDYNTVFEEEGSAFVLRPELLRHIPVYIDKPPPADPNLSYEERMNNPLGQNGPKNLQFSF